MYAVDLKIPWDYPLASKEQFDAIPKPDKSVRLTWHRSDLPPSELNQDLIKWLSDRGITVPYFDIFIQPPQWRMHIHIDQHDVFDDSTKLNFAYCDAEGYNRMCWYEAHEKDSEVKGNEGGLYRNWEADTTKMIHEHFVKTPSLVNAGRPHNVFNFTDAPRICISLPMVKTEDVPEHMDENSDVKYLQWDEAVEIFKDCICQDTTST